jgi:hypothetical protein
VKLVWQFVEGRLLLLQVAVMLGFADLGFWLWCRVVYLYVPAAGEPPRCLTGLGGVLFMIVLAEVYSFFFALWQWVLLRRRWEGIAGWAGIPWLLLLLALLPVWLALTIWPGA